jgi:hypothetical protein
MKRPGKASTTERHCRPIEPVEPKIDNCFTMSFDSLLECGALTPTLSGPGGRFCSFRYFAR